MIAIFVALIPAHVACVLAGRRDVIPPLFLKVIGRVCGLRVRCIGTAQRGALLLGNHVSWLDILALAGACRAMFVAHSGLSGNAALAWLCRQNHTVFITRNRRQTVAGQVAQVREALHTHRPLCFFPESTTNDGTALLPFRSSLLAAVEDLSHQIPVQPFALEYEDAPRIAWFDNEPGLANVAKILRRPGTLGLTIHFLEPLAGQALDNRKTMAAGAQAAVQAALRL